MKDLNDIPKMIVALGATVVGAGSVLGQVAIDSNGFEITIALMTVLAAAMAGALSVYIARITKSLPRTQRIFISYSFDEKDKARELGDLLEKQGAKVWFDENALQPGSDLNSSIGAAIESSNSVVALVSSKIGAHLTAELRAAMDRHVPVYALLPDDQPAPDVLITDDNITFLKRDDSLVQIANTVLAAR